MKVHCSHMHPEPHIFTRQRPWQHTIQFKFHFSKANMNQIRGKKLTRGVFTYQSINPCTNPEIKYRDQSQVGSIDYQTSTPVGGFHPDDTPDTCRFAVSVCAFLIFRHSVNWIATLRRHELPTWIWGSHWWSRSDGVMFSFRFVRWWFLKYV